MKLLDYAIVPATGILGATALFASQPRAYESPLLALAGLSFCAGVGSAYAIHAKREIVRGWKELSSALEQMSRHYDY